MVFRTRNTYYTKYQGDTPTLTHVTVPTVALS